MFYLDGHGSIELDLHHVLVHIIGTEGSSCGFHDRPPLQPHRHAASTAANAAAAAIAVA